MTPLLAAASMIGAWTSTRCVTAIAATGSEAWALSPGGVIHVADGHTERVNLGDGALSEEPVAFDLEGDELWVTTRAGKHCLARNVRPVLGRKIAIGENGDLTRGLPTDAGPPTCVASVGGTLWVGTQGANVWSERGGKWTRHSPANDLPCSSIQSLFVSPNGVLASTLDGGLVDIDTKTTIDESAGSLPRRIVACASQLWLRTSEGGLLVRSGKSWDPAPFAVPRQQATCIGASGSSLLIGQYGGWSEWDGRQLTNHLDIDELSGLVVTAVEAFDGGLLIGTQTRGVGKYSGGRFEWIDHGLTLGDDWVTEVVPWDDGMAIGTFVGGLSVYKNGVIRRVGGLDGIEVTALLPLSDSLLIGTRHGLFCLDRGSCNTRATTNAQLPQEIQAMARDRETVWIGSRLGLVRVAIGDLGFASPH